MAPNERALGVLEGELSSKTWTYVPNSNRILLKSGGAAPVTIAAGLRASEIPFFQGSWFKH
jgi:hypothetical protein